jgi:hypothetical protein
MNKIGFACAELFKARPRRTRPSRGGRRKFIAAVWNSAQLRPFLSAKGAIHTSLGRRPRNDRQTMLRAKGPTYPKRFPAVVHAMTRAPWIGPLVLPDRFGGIFPRPAARALYTTCRTGGSILPALLKAPTGRDSSAQGNPAKRESPWVSRWKVHGGLKGRETFVV